MAKKLVLHIGMHKTGSTSIQRFLSRNRPALRLGGVLYPSTKGVDGRRESKHNSIFTAISHEADYGAPHPELGPSAELIAAVAEQIEQSRAHTAILSAEGFSGEKPDFAAAFKPLAERFEVRVVVFLRRPDIWLESFYRQMVMSREVREHRPISEFAEAPSTRSHLDYFTILDGWASAFGKDAIRMEPFEDPFEGSLIERFLLAAGLSPHFGKLPYARSRLNPSLATKVVAQRLNENAGGSRLSPESAIYLTEDGRKSLAIRLKVEWARRAEDRESLLTPPPFIFSMLDEIEAIPHDS